MAGTSNTLFQGLYLGEYTHALDSQSRVSLPSEWRSRDGETELVLIPAQGKALLLLPIATFIEFVEKLKSQAIANPKIQMAFAFLGANSRQCRCDKQGRLALDRKMLEKIGVSGQLQLIGAVTHIRLVAPENWQQPMDENGLESCLAELQQASEGSSDIAGLLSGILKKG